MSTLGDEASSGFCGSVTSTGPPHSGNPVHAVMCRLRRAPTRGAAASSQPESGDRGGDRADDEDHEAGIFVDDAAEAEGGDGALSDSHWSIADSGSARDSEEGEEELGGASAESGRRTQARTRQPARSAATPPRAAARKRELGALLETAEMQAVLSEHHKATLERSPAEKRQLVQAFAAKLTALKKACSDLAGRTAAAADRHRSARSARGAGVDDTGVNGDDDDDDDDEPRYPRQSPQPFPHSVLHSSTLLATRPRHSERTYASYRAIAEAPDGPFLSPSGTGETKRRALEAIDRVHVCLQKHQQAHPEQPSFDYDRMRAMELASKYPKIAKSVHAEMHADLVKRRSDSAEEQRAERAEAEEAGEDDEEEESW